MFSKFERYILCFIITVYLFAFWKYLLGDIFVYTLPVINYEEGISISREFDVEQFREFTLELQREISEERRLMISQELSNFYRNLTIQHKIEITSADCFLVKNSSSARYATPGSRIEIEELKAAIDNKIKNIGPIS